MRGGMRGEKVEGGRNHREGEDEVGSRQKEEGVRKKERKVIEVKEGEKKAALYQEILPVLTQRNVHTYLQTPCT